MEVREKGKNTNIHLGIPLWAFTLTMEPHGQSPWSHASRPCGATSRSYDCTFPHGQRPWSLAAGMKSQPN
jgi:hypothetical protein